MQETGRNLAAVKANDQRLAFVELLETLADQLDTTTASIHAQLAAQYVNVWEKLVALDAAAPPLEVSALDEITARRAARGRDAADHPRPSEHRQLSGGE